MQALYEQYTATLQHHLSAAGLRPGQKPQWEYLLGYMYTTNKNWGDNRTSLQPGVFRQLLDSGLIQLLTAVMEDHRVEAFSGDTGLQWPPNDATRETLGTIWMCTERITYIAVHLLNASTHPDREKFVAVKARLIQACADSLLRQYVLYQADATETPVIKQRLSTLEGLVYSWPTFSPTGREGFSPNAVARYIQVAAHIWNTVHWTASSSLDESKIVAHALKVLYFGIASFYQLLPRNTPGSLELAELTGLSIQRACDLYLAVANNNGAPQDLRDAAFEFISCLHDVGYTPEVSSYFRRLGVCSPQVGWARDYVTRANFVALYMGPDKVATIIRYWTALLSMNGASSAALKALQDGIIPCLADWTARDFVSDATAKDCVMLAKYIWYLLREDPMATEQVFREVDEALARVYHLRPALVPAWTRLREQAMSTGVCWSCQDKRAMQYCMDCKTALYCSPQCQNSDRKRHKATCSAPLHLASNGLHT